MPLTAILVAASPSNLTAALPGGAGLPRAARQAGRLTARRQRVQSGWMRFTAWVAATGEGNMVTAKAAPRAGTAANRAAATHTITPRGGITTRGGLTPNGTLWYIPR